MTAKLTDVQQALMNILAGCRRDGMPYPSCDVLARELHMDKYLVPVALQQLARLGALELAAATKGREGRSYARRLTLLWSDERIACGGASSGASPVNHAVMAQRHGGCDGKHYLFWLW